MVVTAAPLTKIVSPVTVGVAAAKPGPDSRTEAAECDHVQPAGTVIASP